jgi:hypothetical protein
MNRSVPPRKIALASDITTAPSSKTDSWIIGLSTTPLPKPGPLKIRPGIPAKSIGSSADSPGASSSFTRPGTLVYVDLPPLQGPPVENLGGLEDALGILEREATTARRIIRSHQSRLTCIEGDMLVIHRDIAAMKANLDKGKQLVK